MEYYSSRGKNERVTASQAIVRGLAPDGGLYLPDGLPQISREKLSAMVDMDYRQRAGEIIAPFLPEFTAGETAEIISAAYGANYDDERIAPLRFTDDSTAYLELWHGPTSAFKDMALQMLPRLLTASLRKCGVEDGVCILVATSGDTGKAALEGFADVPGTRVMVFYPRDGVSDVQRLQMATQTGENVGVLAVEGNFDDAQTGVKRIFSDASIAEALSARGWRLSSANSINWGRLLPQIAYYFSAYCDYVKAGKIALGDTLDFCVPTGNFGNILAGWLARGMGLPAGRFICASNENNVLTDFIQTGVYDKNRPFHLTTSPSMDILVSSNLERLLCLLSGSTEETAAYMDALRREGRYEVSAALKSAIAETFRAGFCDDRGTAEEISLVWRECAYLIDTHTAVASRVLRDIRAAEDRTVPTVVVSTASPYKFCDSVLKALGESVDAPGTELIGRLAEFTGTKAPAGLAALSTKRLRFTRSIEREIMPDAVLEFLS